MTTPSHDSGATLVDIGANLTHRSFDDDLEQVLQRAQDAGIGHLLVTGTSLDESVAACQKAAARPRLLSSTAGFHPHHASDCEPHHIDELKSLAQQPVVRAIGECGLDFNRMYSPQRAQVEAFERQIELAIDCGLPLFLHERDAHHRQWEMLKSYRDKLVGGVIHCFTGSREQAFAYLDLDLYLGITGWICDERRGYHLHAFVGDIPTDRLLIETDAPWLTPRVSPKPTLTDPRRNEPCTLPLVVREIARHHTLDAGELARATTANAVRLFGLETLAGGT